MYPVEYNTFGNGSLNNLSMKYIQPGGPMYYPEGWYKEYKIFDHLGNVRSVLRKGLNDNSYTITSQYDYDAWGGVIWSSRNNERAKYIGKETDNESGDHNHGVRQYSDYVGRFLCPDGLWAKYIGWTPYQYSLNNPISLFDNNGLLPGDPFSDPDVAAYDFAKNYNGISIIMNRELGATIYRIDDNTYTYSVPNVGCKIAVDPSYVPVDKDKVAYVHTHDRYDSEKSNQFSTNATSEETNDIKDYNDNKVNGYVATPNGSLIKYDYKTGKIKLLNKDLPSDPNDPNNNGVKPQLDSRPINILIKGDKKELDKQEIREQIRKIWKW